MQRVPSPDVLASAIEIHRLDLRLDEEPSDAWSLLSPDEQATAGRFYFRADRVRFVRTRAVTRVLLARRLDCVPQAIDIAEGPHHKPEVRGMRGRALADAPLFNVSHSGNVALIAIGDPRHLNCVGVDVERCDPALDPFAIADIGCTEHEWAFLRSATNPRDVLYLIWVAKEAALKAVGVGIPDHLHSISIELKPGPEIGVHSEIEAWTGLQARVVEAPTGYVAALAWRNKEETP